MTTQQPEALRLSEILDSHWCEVWHQVAAAKELRRLHSENQSLKQQIAATQPAAQGMEKSACCYPELPAGSEACEFNSYAIVYDADEMREYVDADRRMRAALAVQAKQGGA